jgi:tight adherence protein B
MRTILRLASTGAVLFALLAGPTAAKSPTAANSQATGTSPTAGTSTTPGTSPTPGKSPTAAKSPAAPKPPAPKPLFVAPTALTGLLGVDVGFPKRTLVLSVPFGSLAANQVHVSENGNPLTDFTLTPLANPNPGDYGVMMVIDQSTSMSGTPLNQAMAAARAVAAQRSTDQQLGLITFDQTPSVILPLTSKATTIDRTLTTAPWTGPGAGVLPALSLAFKQFARAKVATGAVILVTDSANAQDTAAAINSVSAAATRAGVQIYTIGVKDRAYGPATSAELKAVGTSALEATPAQLHKASTLVFSQLNHGYLVRYRSRQPFNHSVTVAAQVDGVSGTLSASYLSPAPPPPVPKPAVPRLAPAPSAVLAPAPLPIVRVAVQRSFWTSGLAVLVVAGSSVLLLALAAALVLSVHTARRRVRQRVATFIPDAKAVVAASVSTLDIRRRAPKLLARSKRWPDFLERVEAARIKRSAAELVKLAVWGSLGGALILTVMSGSVLVGFLGLAAGPVVLRVFVNRTASRQRTRFTDQLPSHLQDLSGAMRAGRSIIGAMSSVAESADEPLKGEFDRALADEQLGRPLEETLSAIASRMASEDMEQVALIAALHRRSGSNVAESIDRVAEGARERADLRRELKALTAQARISSWVLSALPPLLLVAMFFVDPAYAQVFSTVGGIIVLCVCGAMVVAGWLVMRKIVNVKT